MHSAVVAINGSPANPSRSRALAQLALNACGGGELVDLAALDPRALLALGTDADVDSARDLVAQARILVVATPVYRATYTALTKTIFDLLPQGALTGTVVIPIATGYSAEHALCIDHALRPLVASLGGLTTPTGVYATNEDMDDGRPLPPLVTVLRSAVTEAQRLADALATE